MILTEKQKKISTLSSGKMDKYEYVTGEKMLPSNQRQIIKEAKSAYSPLGKTFEKQTEKQVLGLSFFLFFFNYLQYRSPFYKLKFTNKRKLKKR